MRFVGTMKPRSADRPYAGGPPSRRRGPRGPSHLRGQSDRCRPVMCRRTNPSTTQTRCRACHAIPMGLASSSQPCGRIIYGQRCQGLPRACQPATLQNPNHPSTHVGSASIRPQTKTPLSSRHDTHTPTGLLSVAGILRWPLTFRPCVLSPSASCKTPRH